MALCWSLRFRNRKGNSKYINLHLQLMLHRVCGNSLPPTHGVLGKLMFSVCLFTWGYAPLLPMTSGGCSGTTRGACPPNTNGTWWMDLELQGVCHLLLMIPGGCIWNYRGVCPLLLMTPGGWIWNYRGHAPPPTTNDIWWIVSALQQISWILFHKTASFVLFENYGRQNWFLWILCI